MRDNSVKERDGSDARVFIVSIWVDDYFNKNFPQGPRKWEKFPLPLVLDSYSKIIGELPEIYPTEDITSSTICYGKWHSGRPGEIRIDVSNPAEGGDYYYEPLVWNQKVKKYQMKHAEAIDGRRPN